MIKCVWIGKTDKSYQSLVEEYVARLNKHARLEIHVLPESKGSDKNPERVMAQDEEKIRSRISREDCLVLLDRRGKQLSSPALARWIADKQSHSGGYKQLVFVVGGAFGFSEEFLKEAECVLSFSEMTLTHQMARLILVEQLYRAFEIIKGSKYHK